MKDESTEIVGVLETVECEESVADNMEETETESVPVLEIEREGVWLAEMETESVPVIKVNALSLKEAE